MDTPTIHEDHWRWRDDDGGEGSGGASFHAAEDVSVTIGDGGVVGLDANVRLRFSQHAEVATKTNWRPQLQYNRNSAGWNDVNGTSSVVRPSLSANFADGDDTTEHGITFVGSGSFHTNNNCMDEDNGECGAATNDVAAQDYEAVEYCFQVRSADVSDGDTIELRLVDGGGGPAYDGYPGTHANCDINITAAAFQFPNWQPPDIQARFTPRVQRFPAALIPPPPIVFPGALFRYRRLKGLDDVALPHPPAAHLSGELVPSVPPTFPLALFRYSTAQGLLDRDRPMPDTANLPAELIPAPPPPSLFPDALFQYRRRKGLDDVELPHPRPTLLPGELVPSLPPVFPLALFLYRRPLGIDDPVPPHPATTRLPGELVPPALPTFPLALFQYRIPEGLIDRALPMPATPAFPAVLIPVPPAVPFPGALFGRHIPQRHDDHVPFLPSPLPALPFIVPDQIGVQGHNTMHPFLTLTYIIKT